MYVGGQDAGPLGRFLIPKEFLRQRSRRFREMLEGRTKEWKAAASASHIQLQLPDTQVETMEDFFIWTFSPQPQIDQGATFDQAVRLGIFAWKYQIPALNNQVTDIIRSNLANGEWQLHAPMIDGIYEAAPAGSPLREVVRAALGRYRSSVEDKGTIREEWRQTMVKHSQLGVDYIEATLSEWKRQNYLSGVCRFHDHQGINQQNGFLADGCPYAQEDCFPRWEEKPVALDDTIIEEQEPDEESPGVNGGAEASVPVAEAVEAAVPVAEEVADDDSVRELPIEELPIEVASPRETPGYAARRLALEDLEEQPRPKEAKATASLETRFSLPYRPSSDEAAVASEHSTVYEYPADEPTPEELPVEESPLSGNAVGPDESAHTVVSDSVLDEADGPVTLESVSTMSEGKTAERMAPQTTVEVKSLGSGKKKNKKKRNSVSQRN